MPYPTQHELADALFDELQRRGLPCRPHDGDESGRSVYDVLADQFGLSDEEREFTIPGPNGQGIRKKWVNQVQWARKTLVDQGRFDRSSKRGWWAVIRQCNAMNEVVEEPPVKKTGTTKPTNARPASAHARYKVVPRIPPNEVGAGFSMPAVVDRQSGCFLIFTRSKEGDLTIVELEPGHTPVFVNAGAEEAPDHAHRLAVQAGIDLDAPLVGLRAALLDFREKVAQLPAGLLSPIAEELARDDIAEQVSTLHGVEIFELLALHESTEALEP